MSDMVYVFGKCTNVNLARENITKKNYKSYCRNYNKNSNRDSFRFLGESHRRLYLECLSDIKVYVN